MNQMVSLGSRISNGWNTILTAMQTNSPQPRSLNSINNSMNVNKIQYALGGQPDGGFSQPVWGSEISTVGQYSREGYTSKTIDRPVVPFSVQVEAFIKDEDIQLAINHLSSQITGSDESLAKSTGVNWIPDKWNYVLRIVIALIF